MAKRDRRNGKRVAAGRNAYRRKKRGGLKGYNDDKAKNSARRRAAAKRAARARARNRGKSTASRR